MVLLKVCSLLENCIIIYCYTLSEFLFQVTLQILVFWSLLLLFLILFIFFLNQHWDGFIKENIVHSIHYQCAWLSPHRWFLQDIVADRVPIESCAETRCIVTEIRLQNMLVQPCQVWHYLVGNTFLVSLFIIRRSVGWWHKKAALSWAFRCRRGLGQLWVMLTRSLHW